MVPPLLERGEGPDNNPHIMERLRVLRSAQGPLHWEGNTDRIVRALRDRGPDMHARSSDAPEIRGVRPLSLCLLKSELLRTLFERPIAAGRYHSDRLPLGYRHTRDGVVDLTHAFKHEISK